MYRNVNAAVLVITKMTQDNWGHREDRNGYFEGPWVPAQAVV